MLKARKRLKNERERITGNRERARLRDEHDRIEGAIEDLYEELNGVQVALRDLPDEPTAAQERRLLEIDEELRRLNNALDGKGAVVLAD
ncbi:MAG: hypothetical protein AAFU38_21000 [Bacteroidota bacterium]